MKKTLVLASLMACTFAHSSAEWEDPAVNSTNRLPARTYSVPLADEADALTDDVRKIATLIQAKAPGLKVSACGKTKPSAFDGIQIENFCLGLVHLRSNFLPELQPRREKGFKTTFYVCGSAKTPNTFMFNNLDEGYWLGAYPAMIDFAAFRRGVEEFVNSGR